MYMRFCAGRYKIPEMFTNFNFPKGYTITNQNDLHLQVELYEGGRRCYFQHIAPGESANLWLPANAILICDRGFEMREMV